MACCDQCADVHAWRRGLEARIGHLCNRMWKTWSKINEASKSEFEEELVDLTKDYARMISKSHFMEGMAWEESIVDAIIQNPRDWPNVLNRMWKSFEFFVEKNES